MASSLTSYVIIMPRLSAVSHSTDLTANQISAVFIKLCRVVVGFS